MNQIQNTATPSGSIDQHILQKVRIPRKFEIFVEELDEETEPPKWKPVRNDPNLGGNGANPVIVVQSPAELQEKQNFYKTVGQRFRIVREIDPPSKDAIMQAAKEQGLIQDNQDIRHDTAESERQADETISGTVQTVQTDTGHTASQKQVFKPKIITIGDVQIKYDGDRVYQKQWVRLTPQEEQNIRIVSDSSNKIIQLTGKHIEMRKWCQVEQTDDITEDIENA